MTLTPQQQFEDKNYHYRVQLEELQEAQIDNKKERQLLEDLQERFYHLQQKETTLFQNSLQEVDPEERAFFEERLDENGHLNKKVMQEFEEEQELLAQDYKTLLEDEDAVRSRQRTFLQSEGKEPSNGA